MLLANEDVKNRLEELTEALQNGNRSVRKKLYTLLLEKILVLRDFV